MRPISRFERPFESSLLLALALTVGLLTAVTAPALASTVAPRPQGPSFVSPSPALLESLAESYGGYSAAAVEIYQEFEAKAQRVAARGIEQASIGPAPSTGLVRALVIPVDFPDKAHKKPVATFEQRFFSQGEMHPGSVAEYFEAASLGRLDFTGYTYPSWVTAPNDAGYYTSGGDNGGGTYPNNSQGLVEDVIGILVSRGFDFSPYDVNDDGQVDMLYLVHAGPGAEESGASGDIWSHKWALPSSKSVGAGVGVLTYVVVPELKTNGLPTNIGVICHEGGHLMGLPDLYRTTTNETAVGDWTLMDAGSWNGPSGDGSSPAMPDPYCRSLLGWSNESEASSDIHSAFIPPSYSTGRVYKVRGATQPTDEYFLVENRQLMGFDSRLPGEGLLIWHVDLSQTDNNDPAAKMVTLEQADGNASLQTPPSKSTGGAAGGAVGTPPSSGRPGTGGSSGLSAYTQPVFLAIAALFAACCAAAALAFRRGARRPAAGAIAMGMLMVFTMGCVSGPSGDAGDPFPGTSDNRRFAADTNPDSDNYDGTPSSVTIEAISDPADGMTAEILVGRPSLIGPAPMVAVTPSASVTKSSSVRLTIWAHGGDAPTTLTVMDDGYFVKEVAFSGSVAVDNLPTGRHTLTVAARSALGSTGVASTVVTVDRTAPTIWLKGMTVRRGRSFNVSYKASDSLAARIRSSATLRTSSGRHVSTRAAARVTSGALSRLRFTAPSKRGRYRLTLTVWDSMGNHRSASVWVTVR